MNIDNLKAILRENGVVGAGGAGFPTYAKLDLRADTIILNCAECEPLLRLHRQMLEKFSFEILSTFDLIRKTVEADTAIIGIKGSYKKALEAVNAEISSFNNMQICRLPEIYPAGDEVVLTYEATGRVVPAGQIPLAVGVTVMNVETVYNVYKALNGEGVTHKYVTITGEVNKPKTIYAPLGITIEELLKEAGGVKIDNPAFVMGGPMMGGLGSPSDVVTKTTNAVLVLPYDMPLVQRKLAKPMISMKRAMSACCQCDYCTSLCPRALLGHPIDPAAFMKAASNGITNDATPYINSFACCSCGLCEMFSCGQGLAPTSLLALCKQSLRKNGVTPPKDMAMKPVNKNRDLRMIPVKRLRARLGLDKYNFAIPMVDTVLNPKTVKIELSQHIGAPAEPIVKKGDTVTVGQMVAKAKDDALSVGIHSSINGKVKEVTDKFIRIEA